MDYGLIIGIIVLIIMVYLLINSKDTKITVEEQSKKNEEQLKRNKFETVYVYLKMLPSQNDYKFKHHKISGRLKPEFKFMPESKNTLYLGLNNILRHFFLSENSNDMEIMKLNYIPDSFDFDEFVNKKRNNRLFTDLDNSELNQDFLPNSLAKIYDEIDTAIEDSEETLEPSQRNKPKVNITYKKNRITLRTLDDFYLNIKYSIFPKPEYDIAAVDKNIVASVLKLRQIPVPNQKQKYRKDKPVPLVMMYYIKFPNDYYLCINKDGLLFASHQKNRIFYFDIGFLNKTQVDQIMSNRKK